MATSLTKLSVWNLAIDVIKDTPIQTLEDDTAVAKWLHRNYDMIVEANLRTYNWNFAREYHVLSAQAKGPAFRWSYAYKLPNGWLRLLPIEHRGIRGGRIVEHEVVGEYIYTNEPAPLYIRCIMNQTNPGLWNTLFVRLIVADLALGMANKFTGKNKFIELAAGLLREAREMAEAIDTLEGSAEPIEQHDVIRVRG